MKGEQKDKEDEDDKEDGLQKGNIFNYLFLFLIKNLMVLIIVQNLLNYY